MLYTTARAEFLLDMDLSAIQPAVNPYGLKSQTPEPIIDPRDALLKSEGACSIGMSGESAIGHMIFEGETYYVTGTAYQTATQCAENHRRLLPGERKPKALPDGGVCELFLYDTQIRLVARHKVALPDIGGGSWCNGSEALGRARKDMNALLYSLHYYPVNLSAAKRPEDIGKGWHYSTYLIRLVKNQDGSVHFVQDDSCLGNPNSYITIAEARKVLANCPAEPH